MGYARKSATVTSAPASRAPWTAVASTLRLKDSRRRLPANATIFGVMILHFRRIFQYQAVQPIASPIMAPKAVSILSKRSHPPRHIGAFSIANLLDSVHDKGSMKNQRAFGRRATKKQHIERGIRGVRDPDAVALGK